METRRLNAERPVSTHPRSLTVVPANGGNRRIFLLAAHPGEGRFTQPTTAAQAWRPELVFMPLKRRCRCDRGTAQSGGFRPFVATAANGEVAPTPDPWCPRPGTAIFSCVEPVIIIRFPAIGRPRRACQHRRLVPRIRLSVSIIVIAVAVVYRDDRVIVAIVQVLRGWRLVVVMVLVGDAFEAAG